jgi:hypothetical protein
MDATRFDRLTRSLELLTRRRAAQGLLGAGLTALLTRAGPDDASAKKKRRKKPKLNAFGCVNVGGKCRGKDSLCCSGICKGKKPKKGEKDTSRCKAHDTGVLEGGGGGGCRPQDESLHEDVYCSTSAGEDGFCWRTTGNAGYCGYGAECIPGGCRKDPDCVDACGVGAACIVLPNACGGAGVRCFGTAACPGP